MLQRPVARAALGVVALAVLALLFAHPPRIAAQDFNAFYCAGRLLPSGVDPYRYGALETCELENLRSSVANSVVPAPLPPYAIALVVPLARLTYAQATLAWWLLLLAATIVVIWAIVELTALPLGLVALCAVPATLLKSLPVGALAQIPIALLAASAVAIVRQRWSVAALLMGAACIEPHMALPALASAFVLAPRMRVPLGIVAVALAALSLAAGPTLGVEYLRDVLPAHAVSELATAEQYSLSAALHAAGAGDRLAIFLGTLQYGLFVVGGVWLAARLRRRMPAAVVLVPMACAVTGGTFIHITQIAAALPFALALAAQTQTRLAWTAVTLVAIPWQSMIENGTFVFAGIVVAAVLVYRQCRWPIAVVGAALVVAAMWAIHAIAPPPPNIVAVAALPSGALAESAWKAVADQFAPTWVTWLGHSATYVGLGALFASALSTPP